MHEVHETLSPGVIIRSRYIVTDLLGMGGFSAVYLVQDLQSEDSFLALKETIIANKETSERFTFEGSLLERLVHPALPRVYSVFDNEEHNRLFMLMDYVEGPNLDTLRLIQHEKRFSLPVIISILAPIAQAIEYLHQQNPPIVHRDIKPANIIMLIVERKTVLVDFGIAKEYDTQGTTSAVRYGSRGYGAPEQYTNGTNTRTDIYGLGATIYTLLTGEIPPDALERMTQISNDKPDPLILASELVPSIPLYASRAMQRAMSINIKQRFATAYEFWQALQGETGPQSHTSEALNSRVDSPPTTAVSGSRNEESSQPLQGKQLHDRNSRKHLLLPFFLVFLLIVGIGAGYWGFTYFWRNQGTSTGTQQHLDHTTAVTRVTLTPNSFLHLSASSYTGSIYDVQTADLTPMILTISKQDKGKISGTFTGLHRNSTFSGSLSINQSNQIQIDGVVKPSKNNGALSLSGTLQPDNSLSGLFCAWQDNQCIINGTNGWWDVTPVTTRSK